ncbi:WhiB family transcriptional regulator [Streptomyces sp. NPDC001514]
MTYVGPRPVDSAPHRARIDFPYSEVPPRCSTDPDLFNPDRESGPRAETEAVVRRAKQECAGCPIVRGCLKWALANPDLTQTGVYAATTARERKALRERLVERLGPDWVGVVAAEDRRVRRPRARSGQARHRGVRLTLPEHPSATAPAA